MDFSFFDECQLPKLAIELSIIMHISFVLIPSATAKKKKTIPKNRFSKDFLLSDFTSFECNHMFWFGTRTKKNQMVIACLATCSMPDFALPSTRLNLLLQIKLHRFLSRADPLVRRHAA